MFLNLYLGTLFVKLKCSGLRFMAILKRTVDVQNVHNVTRGSRKIFFFFNKPTLMYFDVGYVDIYFEVALTVNG